MSPIVRRLATLILFSSVGLCFGQGPAQPLSFSSEDQRVADFVEIPPNVLKLLLSDREDFPVGPPSNIHCVDHEQPGGGVRPQILCRSVPLSSQSGENYLVIGVGGLRGAHIVPFWLFHMDGHGVSLLFKTRSDEIEITPNLFNGYADVRSTLIESAGATIVTDSFRFNDGKYVQYHRQTQHQ